MTREPWSGASQQIQRMLVKAAALCSSFAVLSFHAPDRRHDLQHTHGRDPLSACKRSPRDPLPLMLFSGDTRNSTYSSVSPELYNLGCLGVGPPGRWELIAKKDKFFGLLDSIGLGDYRPARYMVLAGTGGPAQWPCLLKPVNASAFSMRAKVPLDVVASSFGIAIVSSAEEAWAHMCKHSLTAGTACRQGDRVLPGWELQEMVRGRTEWSKVMLVDRGTIVMQTTMVAFLSRDWGVYPTQSFQSTEAKRHPNTSKFFRVLKAVHGVPQAVADRASPTLFRALRAVLTATTVSGIVNVNYKVRADGTPALLEMNAGRPTGDLVAAPAAVVAKFLLEYARRAGACPPGSAFERAEEDAVVSAAERSVFTTEAATAKRGGYSEGLFDDFVRI